MLKEEGITTEEGRRKFYSSISWKKLIIESGEINNSISKIKEAPVMIINANKNVIGSEKNFLRLHLHHNL